MNRRLLLVIAAAFAALMTIVLILSTDRPSPVDYRLARGRALLEGENYLAALQALRDIPANQSRGAETHSYLGAAYLRLHLYKAAIAEFEQAVKLAPRRSDPWIGLASSYIELGDAAKAVEQAERAKEVDERSADSWLILGRAHYFHQNYPSAEEAALKARELDPQHPAVTDLLLNTYFNQGDAGKFQAELDRTRKPAKSTQDLAVRFYIRQGQFGRANDVKVRYERDRLARSILETELALRREPARTDLIPDLVRNMVKVGRYQEAIDFGSSYKGSQIDLELGKAYWMTGKKDPAIQAYRRASEGLVHKLSAEAALAAITGDINHWYEAFSAEKVEQDHFILAQMENLLPAADPATRAFIFRYAGVYDSIFYNQAADEALKVLDANPRDFHALMTISTAYHRLGRIDDATRYMERARQDFPNLAEPAARLASLALTSEEKDIPKMIGLMETAVRLSPNNAGYLYNLGWISDQMGDTAKAISYYQRAINASPLSFEAMNNLALIYGSRGEPDRALPLLQQAIRTDPENEVGYFNIAEYFVRQRNWKSALENYDRVLRINPANAAAAIEKGKIFLETGRPADAVEVLNQALELDSHSFDAYTLLASAYEKMGHAKEAAAATEEARRIQPDGKSSDAGQD